jgi:hypothetical protein
MATCRTLKVKVRQKWASIILQIYLQTFQFPCPPTLNITCSELSLVVNEMRIFDFQGCLATTWDPSRNPAPHPVSEQRELNCFTQLHGCEREATRPTRPCFRMFGENGANPTFVGNNPSGRIGRNEPQILHSFPKWESRLAFLGKSPNRSSYSSFRSPFSFLYLQISDPETRQYSIAPPLEIVQGR